MTSNQFRKDRVPFSTILKIRRDVITYLRGRYFLRASLGVKRGAEFLSNIHTSIIEQKFKDEHSGKSRERLQVALLRRQGQSENAICKMLKRGKGTISRWLNRMESEGIDAIHDGKGTGRSCKLSDKQQKKVKDVLSNDPTFSGFERSNWTAKLLVTYIREKFAVSYTAPGVLALAHRLNCSVRVPRPVPYDTPNEKMLEQYAMDTAQAIKSHVEKGYAIYCMDAAGFANSPYSARGIRPIGGCETVKTNFNTSTTKAIGALGENGLVLDFYKKANSSSVIDLLEQVRQKHGKIFVICDNARAHKSEEIKEYLDKTNGDVVLWHLPPYTPQHNPIEIVWRELKRAIAGRYFDKFEEMHKTIRRLIKSGEVATVKLLWYILDAIGRGKILQKATS